MKYFLTWSLVVSFNFLHLLISSKILSSKTLPDLEVVILLIVYSFNLSHFFISSIVSSVNSSILQKNLESVPYEYILLRSPINSFIGVPAASSLIFPITFYFHQKRTHYFFFFFFFDNHYYQIILYLEIFLHKRHQF